MKRNNAGMSLVEIVVVIAILAILTGTGIYGVGQLTGFRAREAADKVANSLTETRIETLGKAKTSGGMAWEVYKDDGSFYVRTVYDAGTSETYSVPEKISDGGIKLWVGSKQLHGSSLRALNDGEAYRVYFNRSTGAACKSDGSSMSYDYYICAEAGKKRYDVYVVGATGKIVSETVRK